MRGFNANRNKHQGPRSVNKPSLWIKSRSKHGLTVFFPQQASSFIKTVESLTYLSLEVSKLLKEASQPATHSRVWKMSGETKFSVMCSLFNWMQKSKSSGKKRSKFRKFLDAFCKPSDYFSAIRLILPSLDRERGSYGLKESVLATCLIDALGISRESQDALRLINWRKGGAKTGANAGNFSLVAAEVGVLLKFLFVGSLLILGFFSPRYFWVMLSTVTWNARI